MSNKSAFWAGSREGEWLTVKSFVGADGKELLVFPGGATVDWSFFDYWRPASQEEINQWVTEKYNRAISMSAVADLLHSLNPR
jgi:hypothetical protein